MRTYATTQTLSGLHDLQRVLELTRHFGIRTAVCVNKWDINLDLTESIEAGARAADCRVAGRVRYDRAVTVAQIQGQTLIELGDTAAENDIRCVWGEVRQEGGL